MKVWMNEPGDTLYLTKGGTIDLHNTSQQRAVDVKFSIAKKILLKGIVFGQLTKEEMTQPEAVELIESGKALPAEQTPPPKSEPIIEETELFDWDELKWHGKKKFADENGYKGKDHKEDSLDEWYKGFMGNAI